MLYTPPKQMQEDQIWTLVIKNSRDEKVPEHYYTKKRLPLLSWPGVLQRYQANPDRYSRNVGVVSKDYFILDVDKDPAQSTEKKPHLDILPSQLQALVEKHPTLHYRSKSGRGFRIIYSVDGPTLPKNYITFQFGELYNGSFVTTNPPPAPSGQVDLTDNYVASISLDELEPFIPEIATKRRLNGRSQPSSAATASTHISHPNPEKLMEEIELLLIKLPATVTPLLSIAYELSLSDFELNSYTHWLLVSHALADVAHSNPSLTDKMMEFFDTWSQKDPASYQGIDDTTERFERSLEETSLASSDDKPKITLQTLRKLAWAYKIPQEDFPILKYDKKGVCQGVDPTDPRNYHFLTKRLQIRLMRDEHKGDVYIKGPLSVINAYFSSQNDAYLTRDDHSLSVPFPPKFKGDEDLLCRVQVAMRDLGISTAMRSHPLLAGLLKRGETPVDPLLCWMQAKPWDGQPRVDAVLQKSLRLDKDKLANVPPGQVYSLIKKHLMHMAGLRAKADRHLTERSLPLDRFKRSQSILILAGYQNARKTTWVECLLPSHIEYISSVTPSAVKDTLEMQRALAGAFILNIDEVDAVLDKISLSDFKNLLTQEKDTYRTMYTGKFEAHPRVAGFFGTTNKTHLKLDRTGNRRFWIIPVTQCDALPLVECDYQQFWAELLHLAEESSLDSWDITPQEKQANEAIAQGFAKETTATRALTMAFTDDEDDESIFYSHKELDFTLLFSQPNKVWRTLTKEKVYVSTFGSRAFIMARERGYINDLDISQASFQYDMAELCDNLVGVKNARLQVPNMLHYYRDGHFTYFETKDRKRSYYVLPTKKTIDLLIQQKKLPPEVLLKNQESPQK